MHRAILAFSLGLATMSSSCLYGELLGDHCNGDYDVDIETSLDHCGGCNQPCRPPNAVGLCEDGMCGVARCADGWRDVGDERCICLYRGEETCNGIDDDCDGVVDETCECSPGASSGCEGPTVGVCAPGVKRCDDTGQWGPCIGRIGPSFETCDGLDEDCDGQMDEGLGGQSCSDCGRVACVGATLVCEEPVVPHFEDTGFRGELPRPDVLSLALAPDGRLIVVPHLRDHRAWSIERNGQSHDIGTGDGQLPAVACDQAGCAIARIEQETDSIWWRRLGEEPRRVPLAGRYPSTTRWLALIDGVPTAMLYTPEHAQHRLELVDLSSGDGRWGPTGGDLALGRYLRQEPAGWLTVFGRSLTWHPDSGEPWPPANEEVAARADAQAFMHQGERRLVWRSPDADRVLWADLVTDRPIAPATLDWPARTLAAGSTDHGVWIAGVRTTEDGDEIVYRRKGALDQWLPMGTIEFDKETALGGPYIVSDQTRGRVWLAAVISEPGGMPEVRVFTSTPTALECMED